MAQAVTAFNKGGSVVTNANGVARVIFKNAMPSGWSYVPMLTCGQNLVTAYPSNIANTGFTINTWNTTVAGGGAAVAGVTVYWIVREVYNE